MQTRLTERSKAWAVCVCVREWEKGEGYILNIRHTWCDICVPSFLLLLLPHSQGVKFNSCKKHADRRANLLHGVTGDDWWWQTELVLWQSQTSASGGSFCQLGEWCMTEQLAVSWPVPLRLLCTCVMFDEASVVRQKKNSHASTPDPKFFCVHGCLHLHLRDVTRQYICFRYCMFNVTKVCSRHIEIPNPTGKSCLLLLLLLMKRKGGSYLPDKSKCEKNKRNQTLRTTVDKFSFVLKK